MITTKAIIVLTIKAHKTCVAITEALDEAKRGDPGYEGLCQAQYSVFKALDILRVLMVARVDCDDWVMDFPNEKAKPSGEGATV